MHGATRAPGGTVHGPTVQGRRTARATFDPDEDEAGRHRERVVEAAINAGRRLDSPAKANSQDIGLRTGDDVEHPAFGEGVILEIRGAGEKAEATIRFREADFTHPTTGLRNGLVDVALPAR